ncbi:MAG: DUF1800 domain-containing protein [Pseudomonadota bacterium]
MNGELPEGTVPPDTSAGSISEPAPTAAPPTDAEAGETNTNSVHDSPNSSQASRFLQASTFGPNSDSIGELVQIGYSDWIKSQLDKPVVSIVDRATPILSSDYRANAKTGVRTHVPISLFYENAILGEGQLRARAAYSLSQVFVVSADEGGIYFDGLGVSRYMDILQEGAFGNFRDLLEEVTYSPVMGEFLTYKGNRKANPVTGAAPDENFAREIMQLFTIGLYELNLDGTLKFDEQGQPIETYSNQDVLELAKVFTGLSFDGIPFDTDPESILSQSRTKRMAMFDEHHSIGPKTFLGQTIPATYSGEESIERALDILFQHPNTAPFISRLLIQRLTTSNPSPSYVERVATAFESGSFRLPDGDVIGSGMRGDLPAVWAAILLDREFLELSEVDSRTFGKVREPVLRWTHWARAANVPAFNALSGDQTVDELGIDHADQGRLGQRAFSAPSVFNFYRPGYIAAGSRTAEAGLVAPELQITTATSVVAYANFMVQFVFRDPGQSNGSGVELGLVGDYSQEIEIANDPDALIERLDLLYTAGRMTDDTKLEVSRVINSVMLEDDEDFERLRDRVQLAVQLIVVSPEFIVQQ